MMKREGWRARDSAAEPIHIGQFTIGKGPLAKKTPQASFYTTSAASGKRTGVYTDPGFAFNVGQAAWIPEENRWRGATAKAAQSLGV